MPRVKRCFRCHELVENCRCEEPLVPKSHNSGWKDNVFAILFLISPVIFFGACMYTCDKIEESKKEAEEERKAAATKAAKERRKNYMAERLRWIQKSFPDMASEEVVKVFNRYVEERCRELLWDENGERIRIHYFDQEKREESAMFNCESRRDSLKKKDVEAERMKTLDRVTEEEN